MASCAACAKQTVGLIDRACDVGQCAAGFACLDGICRPFVETSSAGARCGEALGVAPCVAGAGDCTQGCRQCVAGAWSECLYDCLLTDGAFIRVESCNTRDDDCDGAVDEATDAPQGCSDRFLDQDGDGHGAGEARCACAIDSDGYVAVSSDDCNDANAAIFPGAADACFACETIVAWNLDNDGDGVDECGGDCNDASASVGPAVLEDITSGNCRDGFDNDCSAQSDCADTNCTVPPALFRYGRVVTVTPNPTLAAGFGIAITFDHAALVASGRAALFGGDVRVFVRDSGGFHEVPREVDVLSSWNRANTRLWVRNEHARSATETDLLLVYGAGPNVTTSAMTDTDVYALRDDFDRPDSALGTPWVIPSSFGIPMSGGAIRLPGTSNANANPVADRVFPAIESGRVELTVAMNNNVSGETDYGTFVHLGRSLPNILASTVVSSVASAVVLGFGNFPDSDAGPAFGPNHYFGVAGGTYYDFGARTGAHVLRAIADLGSRTVSTTLDGVAVTGPAFGDAAVTGVDTLRLSGWQLLNSGGITYDYVAVRALPPVEATVAVGPELAIGPCP
ncbi:MAG: MopE-related protein [Myxococcota bacterium]|nr:MopE-related protein [Myxococcota bacterium]